MQTTSRSMYRSDSGCQRGMINADAIKQNEEDGVVLLSFARDPLVR
ncbi:MAG: hypothetical protein ACLVGL_00420 [Waltera sp.]